MGYCVELPLKSLHWSELSSWVNAWKKIFGGFVVLSYIIHPLHVLNSCIDFVFCVFISSPVLLCYAQVSEGGPSHYVFASAELGPREDSRPGGRSLHCSV